MVMPSRCSFPLLFGLWLLYSCRVCRIVATDPTDQPQPTHDDIQQQPLNIKITVPFPTLPDGMLNNVFKTIMDGHQYSILLCPSYKYSISQSSSSFTDETTMIVDNNQEDIVVDNPPQSPFNSTITLDLFNSRVFDAEGYQKKCRFDISDGETSSGSNDRLYIPHYMQLFEPFSYIRIKPITEMSFPASIHFATEEPFGFFRLYDRQPPLSKDQTNNPDYSMPIDYDPNQFDKWMIHFLAHHIDELDGVPIITYHWEAHFRDVLSDQDTSSMRPLIYDIVGDFTNSARPLVTVIPQYFTRYSFNGQEEEVIAYFHGKRNGIYVDIGANDGIRHSNTYVLEKYLGWSGLLVEPLQRLMKDLLVYRNIEKNTFLNACVYDKTFLAEFMEIAAGTGEFSGVADSWPWFENHAHSTPYISTKVPCFDIQEVFDAHGLTQVDYLSVDAEGADLIILEAIDWTRFSASVVSVECHVDDDDDNESKDVPDQEQQLIDLFMNRLQYKTVKRKGWDLMFFK